MKRDWLTQSALCLVMVISTAHAAVPGTASPATSPATAPAGSPKDMLLRSDKAIHEHGLEAASACYYAANDADARIAKVLAHGEVAEDAFESAVRDAFGKVASDRAVHAIGDKTTADLMTADEKIEGDRATILFKGDEDPMVLVRVGGEWKIGIAENRKVWIPSGDDEFIREQQACAVEFDKLAAEVKAGKFKSADAVCDEAGRRIDAAVQPPQ